MYSRKIFSTIMFKAILLACVLGVSENSVLAHSEKIHDSGIYIHSLHRNHAVDSDLVDFHFHLQYHVEHFSGEVLN